MTRVQLRPFHTPETLAAIYDHPYDHTRWPDHLQRVAETVKILDDFADEVNAHTIADLSCGDGAIVGQSTHHWTDRIFGDLTTTGPLVETLPKLPDVDMYVCSETIEHVEDPDWLLAEIRKHAGALLLSTPHAKWDDDNGEHYWAWDVSDLGVMLDAAGWKHCRWQLFTPTVSAYYTFQIWTCT